MTADVITAVIVCGLAALWFVASRQRALDRVERSEWARTLDHRRPDDTPTVLKARIGARR